MAFKTKTDYFGLATDLTNLVVVSTSDGATASVVEAKGQDGSIIAHEIYGEKIAPSCDYKLTGTITATDGTVKLGGISTADSKSIALTQLTINTGAGSEPTIAASGEQVESGATAECAYNVPAFSLTTRHHTQTLFSAYTITGDGNHAQTANYTISATLNAATKEGATIAHDVVGGKITCALTIKQCGATAPTLTAGEGWSVTSPLACSNPDADYPSWNATLTKYLAKAS